MIYRFPIAAAVLIATAGCTNTNINGVDDECRLIQGTVTAVSALGYTVTESSGAQLQVDDQSHSYTVNDAVWIVGYPDNKMYTELLCDTEFKVLPRRTK
jgi:hypothetical protein